MKINDASIVRTLKYLIAFNMTQTARAVGSHMDPMISLNTCIKNISFIRREYGRDIIVDDLGRMPRHSIINPSKEYRYSFNKEWKYTDNNYCINVTSQNRRKMNLILKENEIVRTNNKTYNPYIVPVSLDSGS